MLSVHYKTPDLIYRQYESVRNCYPTLPYRIVDGSDDGRTYFEDLASKDDNFRVERFGYNIHHGPGMDYGIKTSSSEFLLILDSDVTLKDPILEDMHAVFKGYSVGMKIVVNKDGFEHWQKRKEPRDRFVYDYVHPYCTLIKKSRYMDFKPFIKHGAPCLHAMIDIYERGFSHELAHFPIQERVDLMIRGTRGRWGINL